MSRVVHVVVTRKLAGVERYVCSSANELARRGWDVSVVGGHPELMPSALASGVRWLPGSTPAQALSSLTALGRQDVCHAHMTLAEAVAIAGFPRHRAPIISTRHFAAVRGSRSAARVLARGISRLLSREIAASRYVAERIERTPDAVIVNGVPLGDVVWRPDSRVVLILQRLEAEKDTLTALRAWEASRLWEEGWALRVAGDGSERQMLQAWVARRSLAEVEFTGWISDPGSQLAAAGVLLAPGPRDSVGLSVLEAMGAGVPVVACASGGHVETVGLLDRPSMFAPGDWKEAAAALRRLRDDGARHAASKAGRKLVEAEFSVTRHVDRLVDEYRHATRVPAARRVELDGSELRELVVCSLEAWDEVWRRNQFFTSLLLERNPRLRVLFVEPASDPLFQLSKRRLPLPPRLRSVRPDRRLLTLRPLKPLPRRLGPRSDILVRGQVRLVARLLGFTRPTLWLNDLTYAPLIGETRWPTLYDITDDWLLAPAGVRELERLKQLEEEALGQADEVVVCSKALAETRGSRRRVTVISNGVDLDFFRQPRERPSDLPGSPVAVYVGTLHESRLDVALVGDLAEALPHLSLVLVGPDSLQPASRAELSAHPNVRLLRSRPYEEVPAYLQHADVIVVPHVVSPFTDSLDPIKAHECLAVSTPVVATPVAGFRERPDAFTVATRERFAAAVESALEGDGAPLVRSGVSSWESKVESFERSLAQARRV